MAKERKISVLVKSATGLSSTSVNSRPYVLICVNGNTSNVVAKTKTAEGSSKTVWNETFKLTKEELFIAGAPPSTLTFYVMDGHSTTLGNVSIPFEKISDKDTPIDGTFPLSQGAGQLSITVATRSDIASMISGNYGTIAIGAAAALATAGLAALAVHEVNDYRESKEKLEHDQTGRPVSTAGGAYTGGAATAYGDESGSGFGHAGAYDGTNVASSKAGAHGRTGYSGEQRIDQDIQYSQHTGSEYGAGRTGIHSASGGNVATGYSPGGNMGPDYGPGGNAGIGYGSAGNPGTNYGAGGTSGGGYDEGGRNNRSGYGEDGREDNEYGGSRRTATDGRYSNIEGYAGSGRRDGREISEETGNMTGANYNSGGLTGSQGGSGRVADLRSGQYLAEERRGRYGSDATDYDASGYDGTERMQKNDGRAGGYGASAYGGGEQTGRSGGEDDNYGGDNYNTSGYNGSNRASAYDGEIGGYGNEGHRPEHDGSYNKNRGVHQRDQFHSNQSWWDNDSNDSIDEEEERRELERRLVGGRFDSSAGVGGQGSTSSYETAASHLGDRDARDNRQEYQESRRDYEEEGRY